MVDVEGRPFLCRQFDNWERKGVGDILICTSGDASSIIQEIEDHIFSNGCKEISEYYEVVPTGTLGALYAARDYLNERFLLTFADSYLTCDFAKVEKAFIQSDKPILMTILKNNNNWVQSNVLYWAGHIQMYDKSLHGKLVEYIDYGLYGFSRDMLNGKKGPADLSQFLSEKVFKSDDVASYVIPEKDRFYEVGSPEGYAETCEYFRGKK
jgi:NDP-sugar pyrophosphorylase family protein